MRSYVPTCVAPDLSALFAERRGPVVVCADMTLLGGAECSCIIEEFVGLQSLSWQVLGDELHAPLSACADDGSFVPVITGASLTNKLRSPDAILFDGLEPV